VGGPSGSYGSCDARFALEKAAKIQRMVATVFEPASENGQKGMDELHEQT